MQLMIEECQVPACPLYRRVSTLTSHSGGDFQRHDNGEVCDRFVVEAMECQVIRQLDIPSGDPGVQTTATSL